MEPFIGLFIYLIVVDLLFNRKSVKQSRRLLTILGAFGIWFLLALRSPYCGQDLSYGYFPLFENVLSTSWLDVIQGGNRFYTMETGWVVLTKALSMLSGNFQIYMALIAAIQVCLISPILYKYCSNITFGWIVYFCFGLYVMSFSGIRQATAYCLTFFAFDYLVRRKKLVFVTLVVLASTLHTSAIVFLVMLLADVVKFTSRKAILAMILLLAALPVLKPLAIFLGGIVYSEEKVLSKLDAGGAYTMFVVYVLLFLFSQSINTKNRLVQMTLFAVFMAVAAQSLGLISSGEVTRIGYYFSMFFTLILPDLIDTYGGKMKRVLYVAVSLLLFAFFWLTNKSGYLDVIPYKFFWEIPGLT